MRCPPSSSMDGPKKALGAPAQRCLLKASGAASLRRTCGSGKRNASEQNDLMAGVTGLPLHNTAGDTYKSRSCRARVSSNSYTFTSTTLLTHQPTCSHTLHLLSSRSLARLSWGRPLRSGPPTPSFDPAETDSAYPCLRVYSPPTASASSLGTARPLPDGTSRLVRAPSL